MFPFPACLGLSVPAGMPQMSLARILSQPALGVPVLSTLDSSYRCSSRHRTAHKPDQVVKITQHATVSSQSNSKTPTMQQEA